MTDLSVIIPAYGAEKYVARAIESVRTQDGSGIEIIVVEDESIDRTGEIVLGFPGVRLITNERNRGAPFSRNTGLIAARGRHVMFLDADDFMEGPLLRGLRDAMVNEERDLGFAPWCWAGEGGDPRDYYRPQRRTANEWLSAWLWGEYVPPCSVMWSREKLVALGGWDESLRRNQDGDLAIRAFVAGMTPAISAQGCGVYWQHASGGRISRSTPDVLLESNWIIAKRVAELLKTSDDETVRRALGGFCYANSRRAYRAGLDEQGDAWLGWAKSLGVGSHLGSTAHRVVASLISLRAKERLADWIDKTLRGGPRRPRN